MGLRQFFFPRMTKMPLPSPFRSHILPAIPPSLFSPSSLLSIKNPSKTSTIVRFLCNSCLLPIMADKTHFVSSKINDPNDIQLLNYPKPLSPPLPAISKEIELNRAMSASSKSSLFSLSKTDVIFEDEWMVVVNKPQGIYCENVLSSIPQLLNSSADSTEPRIQTNPPELHLANRLDRDTSGLMVITKSHKVAGKLVQAFTDHKITKTYIALCIGSAPKWDRISLKSGHGRSKFGIWRVYAASDVGRSLPGGSSVRDMATTFEVLSVNGQGRFKEPSKSRTNEEELLMIEDRSVTGNDENDEVLIRAYPQSGRTHQIRLHCQYLGIPIRGDVKYEGVHEWRGRIYDAHELHAESLSFDHPVTGLRVECQAPLPQWAMQAFHPAL